MAVTNAFAAVRLLPMSDRDKDAEILVLRIHSGAVCAGSNPAEGSNRFWRAEKSRSRRTGGSGLGLPIVRHLVAA
ncbi:hypothetical protein ACWD27_47735, partial [Streptomyces sp. NPDC002758]